MKVGSKVMIGYCKNYGDRKFGKIGTVASYYKNGNNVGVELKGDPNPSSKFGYWWFPESVLTELEYKKEKNMNTEIKTEYSNVHMLKSMLMLFAKSLGYTANFEFNSMTSKYIGYFNKDKHTCTVSFREKDICNVYKSFDSYANLIRRELSEKETLIDGSRLPDIKDVIFHDPATIVFWDDGTKTVVKCDERDTYDPEKGLAMAIARKALGNKYDYYNIIKHWTRKHAKNKTLAGVIADVGRANSCFEEFLKEFDASVEKIKNNGLAMAIARKDLGNKKECQK